MNASLGKRLPDYCLMELFFELLGGNIEPQIRIWLRKARWYYRAYR